MNTSNTSCMVGQLRSLLRPAWKTSMPMHASVALHNHLVTGPLNWADGIMKMNVILFMRIVLMRVKAMRMGQGMRMMSEGSLLVFHSLMLQWIIDLSYFFFPSPPWTEGNAPTPIPCPSQPFTQYNPLCNALLYLCVLYIFPCWNTHYLPPQEFNPCYCSKGMKKLAYIIIQKM